MSDIDAARRCFSAVRKSLAKLGERFAALAAEEGRTFTPADCADMAAYAGRLTAHMDRGMANLAGAGTGADTAPAASAEPAVPAPLRPAVPFGVIKGGKA